MRRSIKKSWRQGEREIHPLPSSPGSFGKGPVIDDLGLDADFFLCAKRAHGDPFFDDGIWHRQVRIILVAINGVKSFGGGTVELEQFFEQADANFALAL